GASSRYPDHQDGNSRAQSEGLLCRLRRRLGNRSCRRLGGEDRGRLPGAFYVRAVPALMYPAKRLVSGHGFRGGGKKTHRTSNEGRGRVLLHALAKAGKRNERRQARLRVARQALPGKQTG